MAHCLEIQEQAEQRLDNLTEKLMKITGSDRAVESDQSLGGGQER